MAPPRKRVPKARPATTAPDPSVPSAPAPAPAPSSARVFVLRVLGSVLSSGRLDLSGELEPLAKRLQVGDRLFLQGRGAATGRARLVRVTEVSASAATVEHSWGWSRGAEDPARVLAPLSLCPAPEVFPVLVVS